MHLVRRNKVLTNMYEQGYIVDENGNPDAQDLLGLGSDADWILLNLATDVTACGTRWQTICGIR